MTGPTRIQLSRSKGWRMPENTVKVDRSTAWGNPYRVWRDQDERQWYVSIDRQRWKVASKAKGLALAVEKFRTDLMKSSLKALPLSLLREKNLACWCEIGSPCHADVLLQMANAPRYATREDL
jgi:hypothetical protein